jgi:hypothetical protein
MFTAWILGDSLCLMLVFNICILYPLAYKKKKANLETLSRSFDSILDKYLRLIPFVNKKMVAVSEFKKQQWLILYIVKFFIQVTLFSIT